jgi:hypothetical protein
MDIFISALHFEAKSIKKLCLFALRHFPIKNLSGFLDWTPHMAFVPPPGLWVQHLALPLCFFEAITGAP